MGSKEISSNLKRTLYDDKIDLYRQRARDLMVTSSGLERYVIGLFGPDIIGSLALAFDPYSQFRNLPSKVSLLTDPSPIVRTRTPVTILPAERKEIWKRWTLTRGYYRNPQGGLFDYVYDGPNVLTVSTATINRAAQAAVLGLIRDTTKSSRPSTAQGGEFELFIPRMDSATRSYTRRRVDEHTTNQVGYGLQMIDRQSFTSSRVIGPEYLTTNTNVQLELPGCRSRASTAMSKNVLGMLDKVQPTHRTYDLFYQVAELRDIPRTLRGTIEAWRAFEQIVGVETFVTLLSNARRWRDPTILQYFQQCLGQRLGFRHSPDPLQLDRTAASAFLTYKFGWESTVRAVRDFLPSPNRIAREINSLIESIGKDRTFRTRKSWIEDCTIFPTTFGYQVLKDEDTVAQSVTKTGRRRCELRLVINTHIAFPILDPPKLRQSLFDRKIGLYPTPSDIYNLIPWTWLADWFTGTGDYLNVLDNIANDKSLINYGYITYREESETYINTPGTWSETIRRNIEGVNVDTIKVSKSDHPGQFKLKYQLRRSIPTLTSVNSYWDSDLGPSQTAILGALFASRSGSSGRRDAS